MSGETTLDLVWSRMRAAIAAADPATEQLSDWLAYQLGWADATGEPVAARTAKGMRPALCLLACRAVGGREELAVPAAAAIELTHEFSLIHDDIEDGDRTRRGRPALWTVSGLEQAVNAGDALWAVARSQLTDGDLPDPVKLEMMRRYDEACLRLAEGQFLDLVFESNSAVGVAAYVEMVSRKTGALFAAAAGMGACAGAATRAVAEALASYGLALGVAFQMQDDILGIWGDEQKTGKPIGRDLERRKKSLPVVMALEDPHFGPELAEMLAIREPTPHSAAEMARRMELAGHRARAADEAHRWRARSLSALDDLTIGPAARAELETLAMRAVARAR